MKIDFSTPQYSLGALLAWCAVTWLFGYAVFPLRLAFEEWVWKRSHAKRYLASLTPEDREDRARLARWGNNRATVTPQSYRRRA